MFNMFHLTPMPLNVQLLSVTPMPLNVQLLSVTPVPLNVQHVPSDAYAFKCAVVLCDTRAFK
jgi:hypothetical protein